MVDVVGVAGGDTAAPPSELLPPTTDLLPASSILLNWPAVWREPSRDRRRNVRNEYRVKAPLDDLTGRQLGPYRIVSQVGAGGMAAVYKGYQASMDRYVAVKVLPKSLASDPQFTGRFENEARVLARLQHPHILSVFDFGQAEGYAYFVMPLVETGTLAQRLHGQPLPLAQIRKFIAQIGDALDYAHSRGLLHRDIKPSNVLVDERDNYLLADFGIAKLSDGSSNLTATGTLIGTPAYMSPEQGQGRNLDRRSDLYALGVILYEIATGRVPFTADTPVAVIFKHVTEPLPPVEALNPSLPPALVQVINKALAKRPEERFQTGRELVDAVDAAIDEAPEARPIAATVLEPFAPNVPPPVYSAPPASTGLRPGTQAGQPPIGAPPPGTSAGLPPRQVGLAAPPLTLPPSPAPRRNWLGAILGLGGLGVVGLVGLVIVACLGVYFFAPQLLGLPANTSPTRTPAPTERATRAPSETPDNGVVIDDATNTPRAPTRTPRPTATEGAEPTLEINLPTDNGYSDDFEDDGSGWEVTTSDTADRDYVDGEYAITISSPKWYVAAYAPTAAFTNPHVSVTARTVGSPQDAPVMGLVCDIQASGEYYYMGFSADGYYGIVYYDGTDSVFLTSDKKEWTPTTAVETFADSYTLEADCLEDGTLRLTVDGEVLAEVNDTRLSAGKVGVFAQSFDEVPVEVRFDDFDVAEADAPETLYASDFSDAGTWWVGGNEDHNIAATDGQYVIDVYTQQLIAWGNPEVDLTNEHLAVTVYNAANPTVGFGFICHYHADTGEYYYLGFGSDGYYAIGFYDGQGTNVLTSGDNSWLKSDAIAVGASEYYVEADCAADGVLRLYVDGTEIASVESDTYTSGDIGLFVETWDNVPVQVAFDDLLVTALP